MLCSFCEHGLDVSPNWWMMEWLCKSLVQWWTMDWLFKHKCLDFWWMMLEFHLWYCVCSRNCDILLVFLANWFPFEKRYPFDFCRLYPSYVWSPQTFTSCVMIVFCCGSDLNFTCESFCSSIQAFHWLYCNRIQYYAVLFSIMTLIFTFFTALTLSFMSGLFLSYCYACSRHS